MAGEAKKAKFDSAPYTAIDACSKQIVDLKMSFNQRMSNFENRMAAVTACCNSVVMRLESLESLIKTTVAPAGGTCNTTHRHPCCDEVLRLLKGLKQEMSSLGCGEGSSVENQLAAAPPVVIVHNQCPSLTGTPGQVSANVSLDSKMQVITLNSEADYPDGSWLGDESNAECRVRVPISPLDLLHINSFCHSPEKMALMLLDYLFPREVLAVSNLSGKGKHGKKQLSPLMIYGIRCHLVHRFSITERDWYRIKQNMDSKCRTAWRKKLKGLPLGGFKHTLDVDDEEDENGTATLHSVIVTSGHMGSDDSVDGIDIGAESVQLIHTAQGDIKVLHATPEQLARIQETHNIQVLSEDQLLPVLQENSGMLTTDSNGELGVTDGDSLSLSDHQTLTLVTSTGEVLSLSTAGVSEGLSLGEEGNSTLEDEDTKLMQSDSGDM